MTKIRRAILALWLVLIQFWVFSQHPVNSSPLPESLTNNHLTVATTYVANLAARHGYPMEHHQTLTADGYKLSMYFMRQNDKEIKSKAKTILLSHGLFTSSDSWFLNDPDQILPFKLYEEGYNIMLGNFRGTTHSPDHQIYPNNSTQYWDFSWHKIGLYDVPAMIDYTLNMTGQDQLFLIGHSMGTTTAFVLLSEKPEYNSKLYKLICLAPAVFMSHATTPIRKYLTPILKIRGMEWVFREYGSSNGQIPSDYDQVNKFRIRCGQLIKEENEFPQQNLTKGTTFELELCKYIINSIFGWGEDDVDSFETLIQVPIETTSVNNLIHYAQNMNNDGFHKFNFGIPSNLTNYGTTYPSDYNLTKVTVPLDIFWSPHDPFSAPQDIQTLQDNLNAQRLDIKIHKLENWGHQDFIFSKSVRDVLIPLIMESLKSTKI